MSLNYSDVYLVPNYSELRSRSNANIGVDFLGRRFKAPWIPANMESVIDFTQALWLARNGYFYIYHRFGDQISFLRQMRNAGAPLISISVGVGSKDKELLLQILKDDLMPQIDFITIDVAHAHHILVKEMIEFIKNADFKKWCYSASLNGGREEKFYQDYQPKIIAGNVATPEAVKDLGNWGADAVKVGIAGGAACSTKHQTGFHVPMFDCTILCSKIRADGFELAKGLFCGPRPIPIIADGGIRENGDIAKALVAGATMVMAGGLFAACKDAPGENIWKKIPIKYDESLYPNHFGGLRNINEEIISHKRYHGSASARQKGQRKHVEGFETEIPCNGLTYAEKYQELTESLQSAVSYAGGEDLSAFKNVKFNQNKI